MENQTIPFETYLYITEPSSGESWTKEISNRQSLDIEVRIKEWISEHFDGLNAKLSSPIMNNLEGEFFAQIFTDNRQPDDAIVWSSAGFYVDIPEY